jgi:tagaturonate epimerase
MKTLGRYSIGVGDRFGKEGAAQIAAAALLEAKGVAVDLVWNKSAREHSIIGTNPADARKAADAAVAETGWKGGYFVDADHIGMKTLGAFLRPCDFFTIDVADFIGKPAPAAAVGDFASRWPKLVGKLDVAGLEAPLKLSAEALRRTASRYLLAAQEAGRVFRHIAAEKGQAGFVVEVSMDETEAPQSPEELVVILAALAEEKIPVSTIAPKFSGRFNKGVDYVGSTDAFRKEFDADVCVAAYAAKNFGLPAGLKLSVHSGSDKFSLYPIIGDIVHRRGAGLHLKTAGTTWLEELVGLAESGGQGLALAKEVYAGAFSRFDELVAPYATVVDIDKKRLPAPAAVSAWTPLEYANALRHVRSEPRFNPDFRQLLHVGYKVAAEMGSRYLEALALARTSIERNVTQNLFDRHLAPLFLKKGD